MMELSELGEFGLIDRIANIIGPPVEGETWVGDDAAVIRAPAGTILFTADMLVEGTHFDLSLTGPEDLGYKAIAVNVSDIAAMGGTPWRGVVSLGVSPNADVSWVESLARGMDECAIEFGMKVVGGDISRSDCLVISVSLIGNPVGRRVITRSGARVGDALCVTGVLGASAAGYRLLRAGIDHPLQRSHLRPTPRVREVEVLRRHLPSAMIDVSDGLAIDLHHLCESSSVGAVVDGGSIPVVDLSEVELDRTPMELALGGGEDYELLFTIPQDRVEEAAAAVVEATGTSITQIGIIIEGSDIILQSDGSSEPLEAKGWDHLRA